MALPDPDVASADPTRPIVETPFGCIAGRAQDGVRSFLGVAYAAPPVGSRRFRAPEPPIPWTGVREAASAGANAPQWSSPFPAVDITPLVGSGHVPGDDYLTLNIWSPDEDVSQCPVLVFIHGGAWLVGSKDAPVQNGEQFARSGVVCVAINYRLGVEGFLPVPGVPTNLGLRDQIAALTWLKQNISSFGGDPDNVTVAGESAGAMSLGALITSPHVEGLFRRAILQSGHAGMVRRVETAQAVVKWIAKTLKVAPDRAGFESRSAEVTVDAVKTNHARLRKLDLREADGQDPVRGMAPFAPVWGDDILPTKPEAALAAGAGATIDVLIGTTTEEMNLYFVPTGLVKKMVWPLAWLIISRVHQQSLRILRAYGLWRRGRSTGAVLAQAMTDLNFRGPARRFAQRHQGRTHAYLFDWRSPACDGELGACHGLELPFVFKTLDTVTGPDGLAGTSPPAELADRVHALWVGFARDGTLPWPPFTAAEPQIYSVTAGASAPAPPLPIEPYMA